MGLSHSPVHILATWLALTITTSTLSQSQPVMLPPTVGTWTRADSVELYSGTDLYLLINGGADVFLEYGFERVLTSEYAHPSDVIASAELYEMKNSASAFGLFTAFTVGTGTPVGVGQEAVLGNGYCIFWKGVYVGMLTAASIDSSTGPDLLELAAGLEKMIRHLGEPPELCTRLREGGLEPRRMAYVRGRLALRNQIPQAWATAFPPADGAVGTMGDCRYVILEYADTAAARVALSVAAEGWKNLEVGASVNSSGRWTIRQDDEDMTIVEQADRRILAVWGGKDRIDAMLLAIKEILAAP